MTKRKLTAAIMDEWQKHDAGQGVPYIKWAELAANVPIKDDFNEAWGKGYEIGRLAGWQLAVGEHSGLVAAAERIVNQWRLRNPPSAAEIHSATVTLASALDNLTTLLANNEREITRTGKQGSGK